MVTANQFVQAPDVIWRRIGDEIVIITGDGQSTHILNKTAAFIWEAIDGSAGTGEIAANLCDKFEVSFEEASLDVREIIEKLTQLGLTNESGGTPEL